MRNWGKRFNSFAPTRLGICPEAGRHPIEGVSRSFFGRVSTVPDPGSPACGDADRYPSNSRADAPVAESNQVCRIAGNHPEKLRPLGAFPARDRRELRLSGVEASIRRGPGLAYSPTSRPTSAMPSSPIAAALTAVAIVLLRYVERDGALSRGVIVIKMRGSQHTSGSTSSPSPTKDWRSASHSCMSRPRPRHRFGRACRPSAVDRRRVGSRVYNRERPTIRTVAALPDFNFPLTPPCRLPPIVSNR